MHFNNNNYQLQNEVSKLCRLLIKQESIIDQARIGILPYLFRSNLGAIYFKNRKFKYLSLISGCLYKNTHMTDTGAVTAVFFSF